MARPIALRSGNLVLFNQLFGPLQAKRHKSYWEFVDKLLSPEFQDGVVHDDVFFSTIVDQAFEQFGLPKTALAEELGVSQSTVSHWAGKTLPPTYARPNILNAIAKLMEEGNERDPDALSFPMGSVHRPVGKRKLR